MLDRESILRRGGELELESPELGSDLMGKNGESKLSYYKHLFSLGRRILVGTAHFRWDGAFSLVAARVVACGGSGAPSGAVGPLQWGSGAACSINGEASDRFAWGACSINGEASDLFSWGGV